MRVLTDLYKINGTPMLAPDAEPTFSFEDIDSSDTGRTQDGVMHRYPVRYKVGSWGFSYAHLSQEEYIYMESLFPDSAEIQFTHPNRKNPAIPEVTTCYRSKYSIAWKSARDGSWSNYKFNIIQY